MKRRPSPLPAWARRRQSARLSARDGGARRLGLVAAGVLGLGVLSYLMGPGTLPVRPVPDMMSGRVAQVRDGDSFVLEGAGVRLAGLDAPERDQTCQDADGKEWPCGRVAERRLRDLLESRVTCTPLGWDRYDRVLARCTAAAIDIGGALVAEGLAVSTGGYGAEEADARAAGRGLWAGPFVPPERFRQQRGAPDGPSRLDVLVAAFVGWIGS